MSSIYMYSTVYPGVEPFLQDWHASVREQTRTDFRLCLGQDEIDVETVELFTEHHVDADWIPAPPGSTLAEVRNAALAAIVEHDGTVIFVDSDDVLMPTRVEHACEALADADVVACALEIMSENGRRSRECMSLPAGTAPDTVLPRHNLFGLSNTAWRIDMLRRCVPVPRETLLVDWFLVSQAWLYSARLQFDPRVDMLYRQHGRSSARIRPPYTSAQVRRDTEKVCLHFDLVRANFRSDQDQARQQELVRVAEDVERFRDSVVGSASNLDTYVMHLNQSRCGSYWWESVAYPELRQMWR